MPNVAGVEYPYTPEGIAAAQQAERQIGKMGPVGSDIGRGGQPTFRDVSHRPQSWKDQMLDKLRGSGGQFGNPANYGQSPSGPGPYSPQEQRPVRDLTPYVPSYPGWTPSDSAQGHELANRVAYSSPQGYRGGDMGWQPSRSPSDPSVRYPAGYSDMRATRPIAQAPRGQTVQTTDPGAGYGRSPSGPTAQRPRQPANYGRSPSNPNWTPGG